MFLNSNKSMIYCINKGNAPGSLTDQLINFPNLYCSDTCYRNENNKIIPCKKTCIDNCQIDDSYKFEYNDICYLFEDHKNLCIEDLTVLSQEGIKEKLDMLIKNTQHNKSYIIKGEDSTVIIKPLNEKVEGSTVNIDFSECEKILKDKYPEKQFRFYKLILLIKMKIF